MNRYDITLRSYAGHNTMSVEADGFQIGPTNSVVFFNKTDTKDLVVTNMFNDVSHVTLRSVEADVENAPDQEGS